MAWPWTDAEKLMVWRHAWQRVCQEQFEQNEREADRVLTMTNREIYAQAVARFGSRAAVERSAEMTRQVIHRAIQKSHPTRH